MLFTLTKYPQSLMTSISTECITDSWNIDLRLVFYAHLKFLAPTLNQKVFPINKTFYDLELSTELVF